MLQKVADGEIRRLMVFAPPRSGKSEEVSRLFSAYYLARHPERWVGINSYAADLAYTLSRSARENFLLGGGQVKGAASAVRHWETPEGGGLWAAGVGGPITGKGFHLGIIDDPLKNAEEAASEVILAKQKEWYSSTFYTREEPEGAIVIIQTRWNEGDLSGWLLERETDEDEHPEGWHIVNLPAVAGPPQRFPKSCSVEADWRAPGEALCPERYDLPKLAKIEARIGAYFWSALYDQRPVPHAGDFFKVGALEIVDAAPASLYSARAWDLGATEGGGDYTAGVRIGANEGLFYVEDVHRGRWGPDTADGEIRQMAALDGRRVAIRGPQDPGAAGKRDAKHFVRMLAGYDVRTEPVSGDKMTRARAFASQCNAGNVRLVRGPWNKAFIDELRAFPHGRNDDQVDAAADAFEEVATPRTLETDTAAYEAFWNGGRREPDSMERIRR